VLLVQTYQVAGWQAGGGDKKDKTTAYKKGDRLSYYSQTYDAWVDATVTGVGRNGEVQLDIRPGYWIACENPRLRPQRSAPAAGPPRRRYKKGDMLFYNSPSLGGWTLTVVKNVRARAGGLGQQVQIFIKGDKWLNSDWERLRPIKMGDTVLYQVSDDDREGVPALVTAMKDGRLAAISLAWAKATEKYGSKVGDTCPALRAREVGSKFLAEPTRVIIETKAVTQRVRVRNVSQQSGRSYTLRYKQGDWVFYRSRAAGLWVPAKVTGATVTDVQLDLRSDEWLDADGGTRVEPIPRQHDPRSVKVGQLVAYKARADAARRLRHFDSFLKDDWILQWVSKINQDGGIELIPTGDTLDRGEQIRRVRQLPEFGEVI